MTASTTGAKGAGFRLPKGVASELLVPMAVLGIIVALITPIPSYLLDFLIDP